MKDCKNIEPRLTDYIVGELDTAAADLVRAHLDVCADCRGLHGELDQVFGILESELGDAAVADEALSLSDDRRDSVLAQARALDNGSYMAPADADASSDASDGASQPPQVLGFAGWFERHRQPLMAAAATVAIMSSIVYVMRGRLGMPAQDQQATAEFIHRAVNGPVSSFAATPSAAPADSGVGAASGNEFLDAATLTADAPSMQATASDSADGKFTYQSRRYRSFKGMDVTAFALESTPTSIEEIMELPDEVEPKFRGQWKSELGRRPFERVRPALTVPALSQPETRLPLTIVVEEEDDLGALRDQIFAFKKEDGEARRQKPGGGRTGRRDAKVIPREKAADEKALKGSLTALQLGEFQKAIDEAKKAGKAGRATAIQAQAALDAQDVAEDAIAAAKKGMTDTEQMAVKEALAAVEKGNFLKAAEYAKTAGRAGDKARQNFGNARDSRDSAKLADARAIQIQIGGMMLTGKILEEATQLEREELSGDESKAPRRNINQGRDPKTAKASKARRARAQAARATADTMRMAASLLTAPRRQTAVKGLASTEQKDLGRIDRLADLDDTDNDGLMDLEETTSISLSADLSRGDITVPATTATITRAAIEYESILARNERRETAELVKRLEELGADMVISADSSVAITASAGDAGGIVAIATMPGVSLDNIGVGYEPGETVVTYSPGGDPNAVIGTGPKSRKARAKQAANERNEVVDEDDVKGMLLREVRIQTELTYRTGADGGLDTDKRRQGSGKKQSASQLKRERDRGRSGPGPWDEKAGYKKNETVVSSAPGGPQEGFGDARESTKQGFGRIGYGEAKLVDADKRRQRGIEAALNKSLTTSNPKVRRMLKEAAKAAKDGNLEEAQKKARTAGKAGRESMKYFRQAMNIGRDAQVDLRQAEAAAKEAIANANLKQFEGKVAGKKPPKRGGREDDNEMQVTGRNAPFTGIKSPFDSPPENDASASSDRGSERAKARVFKMKVEKATTDNPWMTIIPKNIKIPLDAGGTAGGMDKESDPDDDRKTATTTRKQSKKRYNPFDDLELPDTPKRKVLPPRPLTAIHIGQAFEKQRESVVAAEEAYALHQLGKGAKTAKRRRGPKKPTKSLEDETAYLISQLKEQMTGKNAEPIAMGTPTPGKWLGGEMSKPGSGAKEKAKSKSANDTAQDEQDDDDTPLFEVKPATLPLPPSADIKLGGLAGGQEDSGGNKDKSKAPSGKATGFELFQSESSSGKAGGSGGGGGPDRANRQKDLKNKGKYGTGLEDGMAVLPKIDDGGDEGDDAKFKIFKQSGSSAESFAGSLRFASPHVPVVTQETGTVSSSDTGNDGRTRTHYFHEFDLESVGTSSGAGDKIDIDSIGGDVTSLRRFSEARLPAAPLPAAVQMGIGGDSSVRGYQEREVIGDGTQNKSGTRSSRTRGKPAGITAKGGLVDGDGGLVEIEGDYFITIVSNGDMAIEGVGNGVDGLGNIAVTTDDGDITLNSLATGAGTVTVNSGGVVHGLNLGGLDVTAGSIVLNSSIVDQEAGAGREINFLRTSTAGTLTFTGGVTTGAGDLTVQGDESNAAAKDLDIAAQAMGQKTASKLKKAGLDAIKTDYAQAAPGESGLKASKYKPQGRKGAGATTESKKGDGDAGEDMNNPGSSTGNSSIATKGEHSSYVGEAVNVEKDWDAVGDVVKNNAKETKDVYYSEHYKGAINQYFWKLDPKGKDKVAGKDEDEIISQRREGNAAPKTNAEFGSMTIEAWDKTVDATPGQITPPDLLPIRVESQKISDGAGPKTAGSSDLNGGGAISIRSGDSDIDLTTADGIGDEKKSEEDIDLLLAQGKVYFDANRFQDAREYFEQALLKDFYNPVASRYMQQIYKKLEIAAAERTNIMRAERIAEVAWKWPDPVQSLSRSSESGEEKEVTASAAVSADQPQKPGKGSSSAHATGIDNLVISGVVMLSDAKAADQQIDTTIANERSRRSMKKHQRDADMKAAEKARHKGDYERAIQLYTRARQNFRDAGPANAKTSKTITVINGRISSLYNVWADEEVLAGKKNQDPEKFKDAIRHLQKAKEFAPARDVELNKKIDKIIRKRGDEKLRKLVNRDRMGELSRAAAKAHKDGRHLEAIGQYAEARKLAERNGDRAAAITFDHGIAKALMAYADEQLKAARKSKDPKEYQKAIDLYRGAAERDPRLKRSMGLRIRTLHDEIEKLKAAPPQTLAPPKLPSMKMTTDNAFSTFSIDVDTASYTSARSDILNGARPNVHSVRAEEFINYFDYKYEAPRNRTFAVYTDFAPSPYKRGRHIMRVAIQGRRPGSDTRRPSAFTFLLDTSGSMAEPNRLPLIKRLLPLLLEQMRPNDTVSLISFGLETRLVLDRAPVKQAKKILDIIDRLQPNGATNLEQGLLTAYAHAHKTYVGGAYNRVVLLSDGVANLGETEAEKILKKVETARRQGITMTVVGLGRGRYNDKMLETLADKGDGNYVFIDTEEEGKRVFTRQFSAIFNVIAKDVKIQVEFDPKQVQRYRLIGYDNRRLTKEQFRDDTVDAGEVGAGQSVTAVYEIILKGRLLGDLATVRVRFQDPDTGKVHEMSRTCTMGDGHKQFADAPVSLRLAATVGEWGEYLKYGRGARGVGVDDLLRVLQPMVIELGTDPTVRELAGLVQRTK